MVQCPPCTWAKPARFGSLFVVCFIALGGRCLHMLCLPGSGTHINTQNLPCFCALPASIQEHSPPKCLFSWQTSNCQIVLVLPSYCPPLALRFTQAHLCDTPFCNISRNKCAIPSTKTSTWSRSFGDAIATSIVRYEKNRCWASKR